MFYNISHIVYNMTTTSTFLKTKLVVGSAKIVCKVTQNGIFQQTSQGLSLCLMAVLHCAFGLSRFYISISGY